MDTRVERDSLGEMKVPADAYYGAQTARAAENFAISDWRFPRAFLHALGLIKGEAAAANERLGILSADRSRAIQAAAREVAEGKWDSQFVVDIFQTGSGTSTNMNANEVMARRANELLGAGDASIHPNDHVNRGQSSNDVIPSAIHIAAMLELTAKLIPALQGLQSELEERARGFAKILKIGRTHLQDATPMTLGQEFGGYATQVAHGIRRLQECQSGLLELALGGTAVGTGINTHPEFARLAIAGITARTGLPFREAANHFEAQGARDAVVHASGALKTCAASLMKIANDIRLLGSGPRLGFGDLKLPATQPGSSIMPGKINPVMAEMLIQVCVQVIGCDAVITISGGLGQLELNAMLPVIGYNLLFAIGILANGARTFGERCIRGLEADVERCSGNIEKSLSLATPLAPVIGYDKAAAIAKAAYESGRNIREVAREMSGLPEQQLDVLLDPWKQINPA